MVYIFSVFYASILCSTILAVSEKKVVEEDSLTPVTLKILKDLASCQNHDPKYVIRQRGEYWVLYNYVMADYKPACHETVTFCTHADYTYADNIPTLLQVWEGPVSVAMYSPVDDFYKTLIIIRHLRDCGPESNLVRKYVSFHIYFKPKHLPKYIPDPLVFFDKTESCNPAPPRESTSDTYRYSSGLEYPINLARNIARDAAVTKYVLVSDVEMLPSAGMINKFLNFLASSPNIIKGKNPRVYILHEFEVINGHDVPDNKENLLSMIELNKVITFHKKICPECHNVPKMKEWLLLNKTNELKLFTIGKLQRRFIHWEPLYIGTKDEPYYDERFTWEGKNDKLVHSYILCILDYDFIIFNDLFGVHKRHDRPVDESRSKLAIQEINRTFSMMQTIIPRQVAFLYGRRPHCALPKRPQGAAKNSDKKSADWID